MAEVAPVAIGSLYIHRYFKKGSRESAKDIMDYVFEAYQENIKNLEWLSKADKDAILEKSKNTTKYLGYIEDLNTKGPTFYENLTEFSVDNFFEMGISMKAYAAQVKKSLKLDWTKYAQPHTVEAFHSADDNSIRIMAGFIQV